MTEIAKLRDMVLHLPSAERAELAVCLLGSLDDITSEVDDAEALRRRDEMRSGKMAGLSRLEFQEACGRLGSR